MCKVATKWLGISLFSFFAIAVSTPTMAGSNVNYRNHVAVARQVDQVIEQGLKEKGQPVAKTASDEDFLRRLTLDLVGRIPSVSEMTLYGLDPDPLKRDKLIQKLIESEDFAVNWSAYWRDVLFSRATDTRARAFQGVFESWLREQMNSNRPWDEIATDIITATGDVRENGATALIFAHQGDAKEITSEVTRIFLGIQIQCANCHDHPTDTWTREQFHQMAAFFPRVAVRQKRNEGPRSFEIVSFDKARGNKGRDVLNNPERLVRTFDKNGDKKITRNEVKERKQLARLFDRILELGDKNGDKALTAKEIKDIPLPGGNRRASTEYYMPDLENPNAQGTLMQPAFFINDEKVAKGLEDTRRRAQLAKYITDPDNPWFAKAFVNRVWSEMLGRGFYSPVDDMGPLRDPEHEQAIELLSEAFTKNGYDTKWLFRTIANTAAYQRGLSRQTDERKIDEPVAFACATPTRLRSEQIFASLMELSALEENKDSVAIGRGPGTRFRNNPKAQFTSLFNYDPSTPQEDLMGTIPQSLFMMNSGIIEKLISAKGTGPLARIVKKYSDDADATSELYLLVLSRDPSENEMKICREYLEKNDNRNEAFEDIMWSLVNSSEFISKR